jgi:hypothetical protein
MRGQRFAGYRRHEVTSRKSVLRKFLIRRPPYGFVRIERGTGTELPVFDLPQMQ